MSYPQPEEIIELAKSLGYEERREETSATLFFKEISPKHDMPPCLINIYYTTRSIMSFMNHPTAGTNELWRSNAYKDIDELKTYFENPRKHSGKGYRNKNKAVRGCAACGGFKQRTEFSKNQWAKGPDFNKCKACVDAKKALLGEGDDDESVSMLSESMGSVNINTDEENELPSLTADLLAQHNQSSEGESTKQRMERRQFNCPECPKRGRGKFVFFKKVPAFKPIVKCPQCKKASRGRCKRLYPVPKHSEKGYGLFKCYKCNGKWGSSRAINNIGQECYECKSKGETVFVKPFRLEVVKKTSKNKGGITGGGPGRMHRVPRQPIAEEEETEIPYSDHDQMRNENAAGNALLNGSSRKTGGKTTSFGGGSSYSYEERNDENESAASEAQDNHQAEEESTNNIKLNAPSGYVHHCQGCAPGLCRSRYLPKSMQHDNSDGNTVSTSASIMTNSSVDKTEFLDRDEDFTAFEDEKDDWQTMPPVHDRS